MHTFNWRDCGKIGNELDINLYSNKWEFDMTIGDGHFGNTISLDKDQVQELIDAFTTIHEEMV